MYQDCPHRLQYPSLVFVKHTGNMRSQLGNSFNSVSISVVSNVQLSSDAPEVQLWRSCGLARMLADAHKQRSDTFQDCGERTKIAHTGYNTRVWYL